jgi:DMSO/TMAO reductase YedYZ molybdopterin-dependent catalytic subunit
MSEKETEVLLDESREFRKPGRSDNTAEILREKRQLSRPLADEEARKLMGQRTRRSLIVGGLAAVGGILGWRWLSDENKAALYRRSFEFNERVSQIFFRPTKLAREFSPDQITQDRLNGGEGMGGEFDPAVWSLAVGGLAGRFDDLILTLADIKTLPRTEMVTEFKCIEGWSYIVKWTGVRFSDFAAAYPPKTRSGAAPDITRRPDDLLPYVSLTTPDEGYFVGWDLPGIMHPQTILAYEINDQPLTLEHGAPLRLASATKYGIKQIKRIGRIEYTAERPRDYWAEEGYDWYAGF